MSISPRSTTCCRERAIDQLRTYSARHRARLHNEDCMSIAPLVCRLLELHRAVSSELAFMRLRSPRIGRAPRSRTCSDQSIARLAFPLPPLAEQRRIVAKVEELMALLDRLEAARTAREATRDRLTAASLARLTAPDTDAEPTSRPTPASPSPRSPPSPPAPTRSNPSARPSSTSPSAANWWSRTRPTNRRRSC